MKEQIRAFIRSHLDVYDPSVALADDDDLFRRGFVNSMFALELVGFVEQQYGIRVENKDLDLSNFSSVANLAAFVARKRGER